MPASAQPARRPTRLRSARQTHPVGAADLTADVAVVGGGPAMVVATGGYAFLNGAPQTPAALAVA